MPVDQTPHVAHRHPVQVHQTEHARAVQFGHHIVGQGGGFLLVHGQEAIHRMLAAVGQGGIKSHFAQQPQLQQALADQPRALDLTFERLKLRLHRLEQLPGLALGVKNDLTLGLVDPRKRHVDADRKAFIVQARDAKRVHAQDRRHVLRPPAFAADVEVLVLRQAQHGDGCDGIAAIGFLAGLDKHDREFAADIAKLHRRHEECIELAGHAPVGDGHAQLQVTVLGRIQGDGLTMQVLIDQISSPGFSVRVTSTLSTRLPSRSTTSKRQFSHTTVSAVRGNRPSKSMIMPASVL